MEAANSQGAPKGVLWTSLPTELLRAELHRRAGGDDGTKATRPVCGSGKTGSYETGLHVFALALILAISTLACGFPLFNRRNSKSLRPSYVIFLCQHFGTGVLIATAFVHLLPTAFMSLTDPCLPPFFNKTYPPLAGFIAMVFAIAVVWIESYLTTRGAGHSHSHDIWVEVDTQEPEAAHAIGGAAHGPGEGLSARRGASYRPENIALDDLGASEGLMAGVSPLPESTPTRPTNNGHLGGLGVGFSKGKNGGSNGGNGGDDDDDDDDDDESLALEMHLDDEHSASAPHAMNMRGEESAAPHMPNPEEQRRLMLQCLLLEAGILFHSVFIGMALSVASGPSFVVFLVAIAFHQCFEGLALGSRIAAIHFPRSSYRPWLMVLAYGTTTPFGQAIGLVVHNMYDPQSQTGLLMVGIMNAISSGLLLFAGLVQLLAEDFLTEKSYKALHGRRRMHAFIAVVSGACLMAIVGVFA